MGEVIVVTSGKDGVGKTVVAANLGVALAQNNHTVVVIDLNIGSRNLDIRMGIENRVIYDVADILKGICRIKKGIIADNRFKNLYFISAPQNKEKADIPKEHLCALCNELKQIFDYVVIDAPARTGYGFELAISPADRVVLVTVPEYSAIRDTELINSSVKDLGFAKRSLVINKIFPELFQTEFVPNPEEIAESLRLFVAGLIPYDQNIHISANIGIPIAATNGNYIADNLKKIAERIIS